VRRRFLQLKVLEFLAREASLEYMCRHNQLALSPGSSANSTPLSTSRTGTSCRTSAGGATDPSVAPAGAGGSPGLAPAAVLAVAWEGSTHSARGPTSSRLWASSPGCQASARSALSTQRSWSTKAMCPGVEGPARRHDQHRSGSQGPMAAAQQPISFELETFRAAGADLLLTGSSGLLTGSSGLLTGSRAVLTGGNQLPTDAPGAFSAGSRGRGSSGGADIQQQQQQQRVPKLGSSVQAAVQAFEAKASESAASFPMLPRPQPPKLAAPAAAGGSRRQPGHMRLVCEVDCAEAAPAASGSGAAAAAAGQHDAPISLSAGQHDVLRRNSTEQEQRLAGGGSRHAAAPPPIPLLKLPTHSTTNACVESEGSSCRKQPLTHSGRLAWQPLGSPQGDEALDARLPATAEGLTSTCGSSSSSRGSSGSSSEGGVSPRCDIEGWEVPASVRSQRRIKQPQLTGDASWDNIIIDTWERETGLEFQFDGLSETDTTTCSGSTTAGGSSGSTPRAGIPGSSSSSPCQPAETDQAGSDHKLRDIPESQPSDAAAPPQLQEVRLSRHLNVRLSNLGPTFILLSVGVPWLSSLQWFLLVCCTIL
jgi:hypothetical protein